MANHTGILDGYALIEDAAKDFGLHPATLRRWTKKPGGLPFTRLGRKIYLHIPTTRAWVEGNMQRVSEPERRGPGRPRKAA
jgi:hypothetical protein